MISVLDSLSKSSDVQFRHHMPILYSDITRLLQQEVPDEIRVLLLPIYLRVGTLFVMHPKRPSEDA